MAIEKEIKIKVDTTQADTGVKKLNKELGQTAKESKKVKESSGAAFGKLDSLTGGAISKVKGFASSLGGVATGFKSVGAAIAASGIGLLLIVVGSLVAAFKSSEEGQNQFAKLMAIIGSVVGNVTDVLADLGEFIIKLFSGDSDAIKSLKSFGKKIFDIVGLPIKNVIDSVKALGAVLGALFSGDIEGAFDELQKGVATVKGNFNEAQVAAGDLYKTAVEGSKEFVKQLEEEAKIAAQIADQRAKANVIERDLIVDRAKADRKIADLREKAARRDLFTDQERKKFLIDAQDANNKIIDQEIKLAKIRRDAILAENELTKSNGEVKTDAAEATAKVIQLETQRLQLQKRLGTEISAINQASAAEAQAQAKARQERAKKNQADELKRLDEIKKAREKFETDLENLQADTDETKLALEKKRAQEELDRLVGSVKEKQEAQLALDKVFQTKQEELNEKREKEFRDKKIVAKEKDLKERKKAEEEALEKAKADFDNEQLTFEQRLELVKSREQLLLEATSITQEKRTEIEKQNSDARIKIAELEQQAKAATIAKTAQVLEQFGQIAGEQTVIGKGLSVASATINTFQGVSDALAAKTITPFETALKFANATAIGLAGAKNVANILKVQIPGFGSGGGNPTGANIGSAPQRGAQAPAFNLTGSSGVNQIAGDVGGAQPLRAYVVGSDVTNQQAADRARFRQASI